MISFPTSVVEESKEEEGMWIISGSQTCHSMWSPHSYLVRVPCSSLHGIYHDLQMYIFNPTGIYSPWLGLSPLYCQDLALCLINGSSVQFSHSVMSDSLRPHEPQHARLPCPSPTPRASCPLSRWCHPTISSSVIPFSSCFQSFPASGSCLMSQFFASGGQSIEACNPRDSQEFSSASQLLEINGRHKINIASLVIWLASQRREKLALKS